MTTKNKDDKNYVLLIGNVSRPPKLGTRNDAAVADFRMRTQSGTFVNKETGEVRPSSQYHRIAAEKAEHLEVVRTLKEGDRVELAGQLRKWSFTPEGETEKVYITEVVITKAIEVLARSKRKEQPATNGAATEATA